MLVNQLHEKFPNMPDLRVRDILVDKSKRKLRCVLSYPNSSEIDTVAKSNIIAFVRSCVPSGYFCEVKIVNDIFTEISFRQYLFEYIKKRYPAFSISKERTVIKQMDKRIDVVFNTTKLVKNNMETADICQELTSYFLSYTSYLITFSIRVDETIEQNEFLVDNQEKLVRLAINKELMRPSRHFNVSNVEKYIGKVVLGAPMYIADIRNPMNECVLCGKISAKTLKASAKDKTLYMCKFNLADDSGSNINCIMFNRFDIADFETLKQTTGKPDSEVLTISRTKAAANDRKMKKLMNIFDGMSVVVRGKIVNNDFSDRLEMMVFDLSTCKIESNSSKLQNIGVVPQNYMIVEPEKFDEFKQASFTESFLPKGNFFEKKYVVLHVNVTGFVPAKDKIIAICGVKISNGHIVERFATYVNPEISVDENLAKQANTEANKLLFQHTITEIIPDLYKFVYGYELIGVELTKLLTLLDYYAEPFGYKFVNKVFDQGDLLNAMFDNSSFKKKPNCSKIEDVARACKVPFEKSYLCFDTATAIARSLIVLANNAVM